MPRCGFRLKICRTLSVREVVINHAGWRAVRGVDQGGLQPGNGQLLDTAVRSSHIADLEVDVVGGPSPAREDDTGGVGGGAVLNISCLAATIDTSGSRGTRSAGTDI